MIELIQSSGNALVIEILLENLLEVLVNRTCPNKPLLFLLKEKDPKKGLMMRMRRILGRKTTTYLKKSLL
jgi:hypothetical protein